LSALQRWDSSPHRRLRRLRHTIPQAQRAKRTRRPRMVNPIRTARISSRTARGRLQVAPRALQVAAHPSAAKTARRVLITPARSLKTRATRRRCLSTTSPARTNPNRVSLSGPARPCGPVLTSFRRKLSLEISHRYPLLNSSRREAGLACNAGDRPHKHAIAPWSGNPSASPGSSPSRASAVRK